MEDAKDEVDLILDEMLSNIDAMKNEISNGENISHSEEAGNLKEEITAIAVDVNYIHQTIKALEHQLLTVMTIELSLQRYEDVNKSLNCFLPG